MSREADRSGTATMLVEAILDPGTVLPLDARAWERLLSCARRNAVLAYLAQRLATTGILDDTPEAARAALRSARAAAARLAQLAEWELDRVRRVLQPVGIPMIALKGAAYILRGMPHARTRLLSDIDIMVPRDQLDAAERALLKSGWQATKLDAYDQQYYRRWSHEIPPLQYPGRVLGVDVHHTLCPPVSRLRPDPQAFWVDSQPSPQDGVRVLSPIDSVLHAAIHLFFDSDLDGRFRDLLDLREMLLAFGASDAFWPMLVARARQQGLGRPLYYALTTLTHVVRTAIPEQVRQQAQAFAPSYPIDAWMKRTLDTVLSPVDPERWPPPHRGRLWLLYARSHWLRMPPHLLLPHLLRKSWRRMHAEPIDA